MPQATLYHLECGTGLIARVGFDGKWLYVTRAIGRSVSTMRHLIDDAAVWLDVRGAVERGEDPEALLGELIRTRRIGWGEKMTNPPRQLIPPRFTKTYSRQR